MIGPSRQRLVSERVGESLSEEDSFQWQRRVNCTE